ncbi:MAG: hypothetical protein J0I98_19385 [Mesorhizobium sp.]|nr:hypothetical protein [Mesorhizobium sp.]MBN9244948.1 hypothetical protein [Mesorhizobium sp.]MBN9272474.1 hypothetical protein [Mesorhizobium sp.]
MVADMYRLERAARLAMGPFHDGAPEIVPPRPAFGTAQRLAVLAAAAIALAAATALFFF